MTTIYTSEYVHICSICKLSPGGEFSVVCGAQLSVEVCYHVSKCGAKNANNCLNCPCPHEDALRTIIILACKQSPLKQQLSTIKDRTSRSTFDVRHNSRKRQENHRRHLQLRAPDLSICWWGSEGFRHEVGTQNSSLWTGNTGICYLEKSFIPTSNDMKGIVSLTVTSTAYQNLYHRR